MSIFNEQKIDCHNHIFDPIGFPYSNDVEYKPTGHEVATSIQMKNVLDTYGVNYALVVGPNSGYGLDNSCLLDAIKRSKGRLKGIAVVSNNIGLDELKHLKESGIVGVAFNTTAYGVEYYLDSRELIGKLEILDMFLQIQVEGDEILPLMPIIEDSKVRILIDHCGRPILKDGLMQPGFQAILKLGKSGRAYVKLSGYEKFSNETFPYSDCMPFVNSLIDSYTIDNCIWGSDWPFLRAPERIDYGVLLKLVEIIIPDPNDRHKVLYENPYKLFGFL